MFFNILLIPLLALLTSASDNFTLYAYGTDINGLELFFADGNAQLGNISFATSSNVTNVYFILSSGELLANPNITSTQALRPTFNSTWSNLELNVPVDGSTNSINFTQNSNTGTVSSTGSGSGSWRFYGTYLFFETSSGEMTSLFFAKPATTAGLYDLVWNLSKDEQAADPDAKTVALKNISPTVD